jgi:hypothetical protein
MIPMFSVCRHRSVWSFFFFGFSIPRIDHGVGLARGRDQRTFRFYATHLWTFRVRVPSRTVHATGKLFGRDRDLERR